MARLFVSCFSISESLFLYEKYVTRYASLPIKPVIEPFIMLDKRTKLASGGNLSRETVTSSIAKELSVILSELAEQIRRLRTSWGQIRRLFICGRQVGEPEVKRTEDEFRLTFANKRNFADPSRSIRLSLPFTLSFPPSISFSPPLAFSYISVTTRPFLRRSNDADLSELRAKTARSSAALSLSLSSFFSSPSLPYNSAASKNM